MGKKYIPFEFKSLTRFSEDDRAVSPLIAVALLVLVSVGFVVAIEGAGSDFLSSVEQPPDANVNANPGGEELRITVEGINNADELDVRVDGQRLDTSSGDPVLNTSSGSTVVLDWSGTDLEANTVNLSSPPPVSSQSLITVVAIDLPKNEATIYEYEVP